MEPKQETMEKTMDEQINEVIDALVADVHFEKTWPSHTAYYQIDLNQFQKKLRSAITHAIEAHDKEIAEKVKAIVIDPEKEHTWQWVFGAARMRKNVLDLLNKQI